MSIQDLTADKVELKRGDLVYILSRKKDKIVCTFSHLDPNGRAYLHGTGDNERDAYRRDLDKVYVIAEADENGNNEVAFNAKSDAAEKALAHVKAQKKKQEEIDKMRADKKSKFTITKRFEILESLVRLTALGLRKALIITGEGGLGKTYTVMNVLKALGLKQEIILDLGDPLDTDEEGEQIGDNQISIFGTSRENKEQDQDFVEDGKEGDYIVIKGFSTAKGLYNTLWEHRNKTIIFDDCDEVLENKIAKNILKAALDSYDRRFISWMAAGSSGGAPKQYEFFGEVIFISNLSKDNMDNAVLTRCSKVDVSMTPDEKIERMTSIVSNPEYMPEVEMSIKKEALELISQNRNAGTISMRTLEEVIIYRQNEPENWNLIAEYSMYS